MVTPAVTKPSIAWAADAITVAATTAAAENEYLIFCSP
jgi:hypothetical protein